MSTERERFIQSLRPLAQDHAWPGGGDQICPKCLALVYKRELRRMAFDYWKRRAPAFPRHGDQGDPRKNVVHHGRDGNLEFLQWTCEACGFAFNTFTADAQGQKEEKADESRS